MTEPAITTQPQSGAYQKDATGKTLTVVAIPSTGACTYQWYSCDDVDKTNPVSLGSGSGAQTAAYTIPTGTKGIFYYYCLVGDGGANTTASDVAKIQVIDRAAKQTWDFTTINEEDIKYNESFWTRKSSGVYNHNFTKATDGTLLDNFGNDLLNGIQVRREAGDASVYVYSDRGIQLQGTEEKPGVWKIPVLNGKYYKITYTSQTDSKTIGYTVGGDATYICGDLTATIATRFTNNANFTVKATSNGTLTLTNKGGNDANCCTLVKIEEVTSVSATITPAGWSTFSSSYPLDLSTISGGTVYYASAASGSKVTLTPTGDVTVPAGEGLMIKGTAGETFTINVAASGEAITGNLLKGQTTTGDVAASADGAYHYVFGYKTSDATEYGFYNLASATEVPAGKAYLETTEALTPTGSSARVSIVFEDVNGINDVNRETISNNRIYNLSGQEVAQPTKGLYIVSGKIVIIK